MNHSAFLAVSTIKTLSPRRLQPEPANLSQHIHQVVSAEHSSCLPKGRAEWEPHAIFKRLKWHGFPGSIEENLQLFNDDCRFLYRKSLCPAASGSLLVIPL